MQDRQTQRCTYPTPKCTHTLGTARHAKYPNLLDARLNGHAYDAMMRRNSTKDEITDPPEVVPLVDELDAASDFSGAAVLVPRLPVPASLSQRAGGFTSTPGGKDKRSARAKCHVMFAFVFRAVPKHRLGARAPGVKLYRTVKSSGAVQYSTVQCCKTASAKHRSRPGIAPTMLCKTVPCLE